MSEQPGPPQEEGRDYVGVKPCGCWVSWCSARMPAKDRAKEVGAWIRGGLGVERATTDEARSKMAPCRCNEKG